MPRPEESISNDMGPVFDGNYYGRFTRLEAVSRLQELEGPGQRAFSRNHEGLTLPWIGAG